MTIKRYHPSTRYSEACVHGNTVYLSGQIADVTEGRDCADQARQVFAYIDTLLAEVGSDKSKLLQATVWLKDMSDYDAFNAEWDAWLAGAPPPVRACVQARLANSGYLVEVMVVAAL
jgi:enamine deaminase RidA (YjgF/YER057c/UK114 family)